MMDRFDVVQAYYWWLTDHHNGQFSPEYARLSKLAKLYKPSIFENRPNTYDSRVIYNTLCDAEGCDHDRLDEYEV